MIPVTCVIHNRLYCHHCCLVDAVYALTAHMHACVGEERWGVSNAKLVLTESPVMIVRIGCSIFGKNEFC